MNYLTIPIPVDPEDAHLPMSILSIKLPSSGKVAHIALPIQGGRTIDNALATLALWKRTLCGEPVPADTGGCP